jgi:hypothetical protein
MNHDKARYVGIDCGIEGGIAWLDKEGSILGVMKMPKDGEGNTDFLTLARLLRQFPKSAHVITELLNPLVMAGKKQVASLARQSAILECALAVNKLPFTKVNPKKWQGVMWVGQKIITKEVKLDNEGTKKFKTDTKKVSSNAFIKLFPRFRDDKRIVLRSGRLHDGIVDACLIALYGKRANL